MPQATPVTDSLMERKRRIVKLRIVEAADELFARDGYDSVSVADIAARADVGRTTFFRYFGDKAEVVFAHEEEILGRITQFAEQELVDPAHSPAEAVEQLRPIFVTLCDQIGANNKGFTLHYQLIEKHVELRARDALKAQRIADRLTEILTSRGTAETTAIFAVQVALACYQTGLRRATNGHGLSEETRAAFDQLATL